MEESPTQTTGVLNHGDRVLRTKRSALWAAYGDALGFVSELTDREGLLRRTGGAPLRTTIDWQRRIGGRSGVTVALPAGCYSDDTQLRLSTARAIGPGGFDVEAFARIELPVWLSYALGGGTATKAAATNLGRPNIPWFANTYRGWLSAGGNGVAMRIQPHVWAASNLGDPTSYLRGVVQNAVCTHGHPVGIMGAALHAVTLAHALQEGKVPPRALVPKLLEALLDVPRVVRTDPELGEVWRVTWERAAQRGFEEAWTELHQETTRLVDATMHIGGSGASAYEELVAVLRLTDRDRRGSGVLTAIAALALTWFEPEPSRALALAANTLGTDTDTIATMAGAILGATASADPPGKVMDSEVIAGEAERMAYLAAGQGRSTHTYPDLLTWLPPRSQADALVAQGDRLHVAGLGSVSKTLGEPIVGAQREFSWQWIRLELGQTLLIKRRKTLAVLDAPLIDHVSVPQRALPGLDDVPAAGQLRDLLHKEREGGPSHSATKYRGRPANGPAGLPQFDQGAGHALDIDRVIAYLEREHMANDALGYSLRRVAQDATPERAAAFLAFVLERLRALPPGAPPLRDASPHRQTSLDRPARSWRDEVMREVKTLIRQRVHSWAALTAQEIDILRDWVMIALDRPGFELTYPIVGEDGAAVMRCHPKWTATTIHADGRQATLSRIAGTHRMICKEAETWEITRKMRPGPPYRS